MPVFVEATGCSNACHHCAVDGRPPQRTFYTYQDLQGIVSEWGPVDVLFEPTLHPEFPKIVNRSIVSDSTDVLSTNGYGLVRTTDPQALLHAIADAGYTGLSFTLHGLQAHHDWFVGRQGAYADIIAATRLARSARWDVWWNIFLDNQNLNGVALLGHIKENEFGGSYGLSIPFHRVSPRMWRYESLRPSLRDVLRALPDELIARTWKQPLEELTEGYWYERWRQDPTADVFRSCFEPRNWPPSDDLGTLAIFIGRDHMVSLDVRCVPPLTLGNAVDGRNVVLAQIDNLPIPWYKDLAPGPNNLGAESKELLHNQGYSVRYKAISRLMYANEGTMVDQTRST